MNPSPVAFRYVTLCWQDEVAQSHISTSSTLFHVHCNVKSQFSLLKWFDYFFTSIDLGEERKEKKTSVITTHYIAVRFRAQYLQ